MRQTKRKQMFLQMYDHTGFERRLEEMALEGWRLEACGSLLGWKFRRMKPMPLRYKVVYFPDASEYDPAPGDKQEEFIELCSQAGWEYIDHMAQMLIFCTADPEALPIETDAMMQVEVAHNAMKKSYLPGQIGLLALAVLQLLLLCHRWNTEPVYLMMYDAMLVTYAAYFVMAVLCVYHLAQYYLWRRKALAAAEDGEFVATRGKNLLEKLCLLVLAVVFGAWLISMSDDAYLMRVVVVTFVTLIGVIAAVDGLKLLMRKTGLDTETSRTLMMLLTVLGTLVAMVVVLSVIMTDVDDDPQAELDATATTYEFDGMTVYVYDDHIPLTLEDLGYETDDTYDSKVESLTSSVLIAVYNGQQIVPRFAPAVIDNGDLYYTITMPRFLWMVDICAADVLDDARILNLYGTPKLSDPAAWGAEQLYAHMDENGETGYYTAIYTDRVVEVYFPEVPTPEQIEIAAAALREYEVR